MIRFRIPRCLVFALTCSAAMASAAAAQTQGADEVVVPLTDPSRPAVLSVSAFTGNIVVRGANRKDVMVRSSEGGRRQSRRRQTEPPPGLRRLTPDERLSIEERNNEVSIEGGGPLGGSVDFDIEVPLKTSLKLSTVNGNVTVNAVDGMLEINSVNGEVSLANIAGSVVAHSVNGDVTAVLTRADAGAPMAFTTLNGDVDVTMPATIKANLKLRTDNGDMFTDFDIPAASSRPAPRGTRQGDGRFRFEVERAILTSLNGGGPDIELRSFNGRVYLRKGK